MQPGNYHRRQSRGNRNACERTHQPMHTLVFSNPGHFHAALSLRQNHPRINEDIYVYAEEGPDLEAFLVLVNSFNDRTETPTHWRLHVVTGQDWLERMIAERKGNIAVAAGKNDQKMAQIRQLHDAGFHVLGDKPLVIDIEGLEHLHAAMSSPPLLMDIMTERYEVTLILLRALLGSEDIFGGFRTGAPGAGDGPAMVVETVHQLYKTVNDRVLVRYPWYFDVTVQGDGLVDIPTHLVDQAQWLMGDATYDYDAEVELHWAKRWNTDIDAEAFERITLAPAFPTKLAPWVRDGVLGYPCNGAIGFSLRGVPVEVRSEWGLTTAPAADSYHLFCRGRRAEILLEHGAHANSGRRLLVRPHDKSDGRIRTGLRRQVSEWQEQYPGTALRETTDGWEITVPEHLLIGHEEHFALVLQCFLDYVSAGAWPENLSPNIVTKYTLLANASELAGKEQ